MATYTTTIPFGIGTVKVDCVGLSLCDFHLLSKNIDDFIAARVSQSLGPMRPLEPEERAEIAMTSWHTPPIGELEAPFEESGAIPPEVLDAASTEIAGMDRYNNYRIRGYPIKRGKDSKFDTCQEAIQAFRNCIKKGINVGGITFQKCRNKWIWSIRTSKTPDPEPNAALVDKTFSWIPRCFEEYEQQCKQEEQPPCYDGSDGVKSYHDLNCTIRAYP